MDLSIQKLSKAFNQNSVFSDLTFDISRGSRFAITGSNGSGKSTLLKILSGGTLPSSGTIAYTLQNKKVREDQVYRYVHFVAPYNTVIEELTLRELFHLHQQLGLLKNYTSFGVWLKLLQYPFDADKQIKVFSSGMKQRIKLGLALLDDRPLILLDEPGSNLDSQGKAWLETLVLQIPVSSTLIIASNDPVEIGYCQNKINLGPPQRDKSGG